MLALGRALMSEPAILLMDEPSLGLAPLIVKEIFRIIKKINEDGMTILLVEQNSRAALNIAHRGYVLVNGEIALSDSAEKLVNDENVRKKYLGEE
jgi:branched-chain amino acid transport system ATP-binding protein